MTTDLTLHPDLRATTSLSLAPGTTSTVGSTVFHAVGVVPAALADQAWELYATAFEELRTQAAQRHVLFREEFDAVMADARVTKLLGFDGQTFAALAIYSTDLAAVPLVSPEYYAARFPREYAERVIYYVGFFAVRPDRQRSGILIDLMRSLALTVAAVGGIVAMDISGSRRARHMDKAVFRAVRSVAPQARCLLLDEQSFWAYEMQPAED